MALYIVGIALILGFVTLLWRRYQRGDGWQRDLSFLVDLLAMTVTALVVGGLVWQQLQEQPASEVATVPLGSDTALVSAASAEVETPPEEAEVEEVETEADEEPIDVDPQVPEEESEATTVATPTTEAETEELVEASTPEAAATPTAEPTATPAPTEAPAPATQSYTVQQGDTLGAIAQRFGVTNQVILAANPGINPDSLSLDQVLTIPTTNTPVPAPTTITYTVQQGDVLSVIARRFGVTTERIAAANPGINMDSLRIGQVLAIPTQ